MFQTWLSSWLSKKQAKPTSSEWQFADQKFSAFCIDSRRIRGEKLRLDSGIWTYTPDLVPPLGKFSGVYG